jgi:hypothetical protein
VLLDRCCEPLSDGHAAALDTDEGETVSAAVLLDDLVTDTHEGASDVVGGHDLTAGHESKL